MADFGIGPDGVRIPRVLDYIDTIDQAYFGDTGVELDSTNKDNARDVLVRMNGYVSAILGRLGGQVQAIRDLLDPETASGAALRGLARIRNITPGRSTFSRVAVQITGTPGATFGIGQIGVRGGGRNNVVATWTLAADVTLSPDGEGLAVFQADEIGAIPAAAGDIASLATPVAGIDAVTNPDDAAVGLDEDEDGDIRLKLRTGGSVQAGGANGLRARILALQDSSGATFIQDCLVIANPDSEPRMVLGSLLPAHSYLVAVVPGPLTVEQQQLVLGEIYDSSSGTSEPAGTDVDGTVVFLANGSPWPVAFDYGEDITLSVALTGVTLKDGFSEDAMRSAVGRELLTLLPLTMGADVTLVDICGVAANSGAVRSLNPSNILLNGVNADFETAAVQRVAAFTLTVNGVAADLTEFTSG